MTDMKVQRAEPVSSATTVETAPPIARITELHRAGRLAREFPLAVQLLNGLDQADLVRAGQLLVSAGPDAVLAAHPSTPVVRVAITGHGTLNMVIPPLTAELARHGLLLQPTLSDYDNYVFDLSDADSGLYRSEPDIVLLVLDPMVIFDEVASPWDLRAVQQVLADKLRLVEWLATTVETTCKATLVVNTIPLPRRLTAQLVDYRSRAGLGAAWRRTNAQLLELSERHPSVVVVDLDPLLAEGIPAEDIRLATYTKVYLSPALLARYAREISHLARHLTGRTKKALALDLDNTLWGGILGDDGVDGIEVAESYRGEAFRAFQKVVKQLGSQGVLLTAISKNDPEPVQAVLRAHPDMTVREDDFVQITANWQPKPENLKHIAAQLNIKSDSFVFVDDSPYECGLMRHVMPEVRTIRVDTEPALHIQRLLDDGWFDVRELTVEDRQRSSLYRDERARSDFLQKFESLDEYLRELQVEVSLYRAGAADVNRVSQITLRTNQFNLTTMRLQPTDIEALIADPDAQVLAIRARDRFGDNGTVGTMIVRRTGVTAQIENFLLSCRVFSRGIEQACLSAVLAHLRDDGCESVAAAYRPTAKNATVKDLYTRYGFDVVADDPNGVVTYKHALRDVVDVPTHLTLITNLDRETEQ